MTPRKTANELRQELADAKAEYIRLGEERDEAQAQAKRAQAKMDTLHGWGGGTITTLKGELYAAIQYEADIALPTWRRFTLGGGSAYVIESVTPKRVNVREVGTTVTTIYDRETGRQGKYGGKIPDYENVLRRFLAGGEEG